ncbi:glutathione S-transferase domain-containing protein [Verticillium alfalfae VaMs.102]|uniref:Glutathione S-transferase domain-containing protein n=1 Tax=Verticillium alfalfae (strain VaMs.102 / ATCC MYA-4576 / FGSC 10136) TaxID=526221 RepID=C9SNF0_VERA1|nr:glutathione S-transferase domain-containing protein [Verticillium alfalfae VaMs.102]EEY20315.1 glutathione S-transferase domain-containing protein [Verticillium alfalfae VaMs.102]
MALRLYEAPAPNPFVVRLFALERGGLDIDVEQIDIMTLQNRRLSYRTKVNPRGELPALRVGNEVITEITAICELLDEVATGGDSLFGNGPIERAKTRMWLRRMDLEIAQPIITWFRNDPDTIDFYKGNRLPTPQARVNEKVSINQALNRLDDELEGKNYLAGDRFSAADIHLYGLTKMMISGPGAPAGWVLAPGRTNFLEYFARIDGRAASQKALNTFGTPIKP